MKISYSSRYSSGRVRIILTIQSTAHSAALGVLQLFTTSYSPLHFLQQALQQGGRESTQEIPYFPLSLSLSLHMYIYI